MSWADWRGELAKACDGSHWTIDGIEQRIQSGDWHLIEAPDCCYVVEIQTYETERSCTVWWAAGDLDAILGRLDNLHDLALRNGCSEMLVEGNPAWARLLKSRGYRLWSVTLRKALHGPLQ